MGPQAESTKSCRPGPPPVITANPMLQYSWVYFAILLAGMAASAGYAPFLQLLL